MTNGKSFFESKVFCMLTGEYEEAPAELKMRMAWLKIASSRKEGANVPFVCRIGGHKT